MSNPFFPNRAYPRRQNAYGAPRYKPAGGGNFYRSKSSLNFSDNFSSSDSSNLHNSTMSNASFLRSSESFGREPSLLGSNMSLLSSSSDRPSFSSLFTAANESSSSQHHHQIDPFARHRSSPTLTTSSELSSATNDDDGVYLQISNLDQWYDEANLRNYLMNQLKPITPILSLSIETPSIAKVKVPSTQFAKQVVSHLHRKKMGHKRIFVSFLKDKTSAECSALRNKVIGLLRDVPSHELQMCKFRELFQSRFKSSISILDLYKMSDLVDISVGENEEKSIALKVEYAMQMELDGGRIGPAGSELSAAPYSTYCILHYKPDKNKGWAEIEIEPLPNVMMSIKDVQSIILPLLRKHRGEIPIASLLYCLDAELGVQLTKNDHGVALEHLVSAVPGVEIKYNDYGIKILSWHDDYSASCDDINTSLRTSLNLSHGEAAETISKEVIELVKMCAKSTMMFSKFIPTYHNHFGKQCRVADYGCTKLIELFEAMSSIVQVLGEGESRQITLSHRTQLRRFSIDMFKVLRAQASKSLQVANIAQAYLATHNRIFDVTDYGVCYIEDLLEGLRNNSFITMSRKRGDEIGEAFLYIQKRRQSNAETEKTSMFAGEVVELLRNSPQFSILFRKFVRSYHYFFGYQCKLSDYGFVRLAELLEALHGIVEIDASSSEETKKIALSRKVALRIFSEQLQGVIKEMTGGKPGTMAKVDDVLEVYKSQLGYQMQGSSLGYNSVIDALKFVPFIEMSSCNNELWITHHLENEKFRQRAMMACMVIVDIGNKVPLAKFNLIFVDKFKFSIGEKSLHAMKHAVEIEMVNGVKMISLTALTKFLMHIVNILEHKPRMNIGEVRAMMKLNLTSTFNLGYPNLASVVRDFPDLFVVSSEEKGAKDCFDVELSGECALTPSGLKKILDKKRIQQPDEKPEMFSSPKINSKLPPKMRCIQKPTTTAVNQQSQQQQQIPPAAHEQYYRNLQLYSDQYYRAGNPFAHPTLPDVATQAAAAAMSANVANQLFNYQLQQQKFANGGAQQQQPNPFADSGNVDKLNFFERNLRMQQQQQQQQFQAMKQQDFLNSTSMSFSQAGSNSFDTSEPPYSMMGQSSFGNNGRFSAAKPDTPPSCKPNGLWLDPVWNCDGSLSEANRGGNQQQQQVDAVKGFNFHVVSPFLSFKTMFTFDNPNQSN